MENGQLPIFLAAWSPPIAALALAFGLMLQMEDAVVKNRMVHIVLKALSLSLLFASQCLSANGPATLIADQLFIDRRTAFGG